MTDSRPLTPVGCQCSYSRQPMVVPPYTETPEEAAWRREVDPLLDKLDSLGLCRYWYYDHVVSAALGRPACWHQEGRAEGVTYLKHLLAEATK
ncbi:hypothetical protein [Deinococcus wulumuqiensis]|uniref:Uncharacterized protein n=1 Tax=Deinococcus wulumuqiensis TaxID=980427 RepID=A0AAV4K5Y7_9DEIO|nr:hypothetical protein [Deinococcus wulumuqiensis]QII20016.1 hypothetical protein G6R31_04020 [Deinococcus wulumuqiensis R12]GGI86998.1 hypothetical protein GCM10010914_21780 [Deinococcus wulumuqiensis]GGP29951.1 hypothetical protein GCM10008021_16020 [Deinococcus wulumuqiensis]